MSRQANDDQERLPLEQGVDLSISRECVYRKFKDHPGPCPHCGKPLRQWTAVYLVATRRGDVPSDTFVISNDDGWFCTHCPTLVINPDEISDFLQMAKPGWDIGEEFALLGIVDLDTVPDDKQHLSLSDPDCPLPLVEFRNLHRSKQSSSTRRPPRSRTQRKKRRRRKR